MVIDMVLPKNGFLDFIAKYEFLGHDEGKVLRFFLLYTGLVSFNCSPTQGWPKLGWVSKD